LQGPASLPQRPILRDRRPMIRLDGERHVTLDVVAAFSYYVFKFIIETNTFLYHLDRSWKVVENAGGHGRNLNGIIGLLCREHFPRLIEYAGVTGPSYTFDHYVVAPDAVDQDDREFNTKAERVKQEMWVSLPRPILVNMLHSLHILEIMYGYIVFVCMISSDVRLDTRPTRMSWLPRAIRSSSWTCTTRRESRPSSLTMAFSLGRR
jgi:hypothetical protein